MTITVAANRPSPRCGKMPVVRRNNHKNEDRRMRKTLLAGALAFLTLVLLSCAGSETASQPGDARDQQELINRAQQTVQNFSADPDMQWFRDNVGRAHGIFIVPTVVRAGFFLGGSGGSGVLLAREAQTGQWSYPAFYTMGAVSFGLQIGADVGEVVLLVMTDRGLDSFLSRSFRLGADVSVAAGPVGAGAAAQTADIVAFTRSRGIYGGLTVSGAVIEPRQSWNADYYGRPVRAPDILVQRNVSNPQADPLRTTVASIARRNGR